MYEKTEILNNRVVDIQLTGLFIMVFYFYFVLIRDVVQASRKSLLLILK